MTDLLDVHLFQYRDDYLLFDVGKFRVHRVDSATARQLSRDPETGLYSAVNARKPLLEGLSRWCPETAPRMPRRVTGLTMLLNQRCNMRCLYCYAGTGTYGAPEGAQVMSETTARAAVDLLLRLRKDARLVVLTFFGGEPLLDLDLLRAVVRYAKQRASSEGVRITFVLVTNGTLLQPEVLKYLIREDIRVVVSLDGDQETNDAVKLFTGGHHDKVVSNIEPFRKRLRFTVRTTVSGPNASVLSQTVEHFRKLCWPMVVIEPVALPSSHPLALNRRKDAELHASEESVYERIAATAGPWDRRIVYPYTHAFIKLVWPRKNYHGCSAGRASIAVDCQGNVFACHRDAGASKEIIGHVGESFDWSKLEPYYEANICRREPCRTCWARYLCSGGCVWLARRRFGDISRPDPDDCAGKKRGLEAGMFYSRRISRARLAFVLPNLLRSLRISAGHHIKATDWELVELLETGWRRHFW